MSTPVDETLDFTAPANVPANALGEQVSFAEYMQTFHATEEAAYAQADTPIQEDTRIQNVNFREDAVLDGGYLLEGTRRDDDIVGRAGDDDIFGLSGNDVLIGLGGDDRLDGGNGRDRMFGGVGDDTYVVDDKKDRTIEKSGEGTDTVLTSVSLTLDDQIDIGILTGRSSSDLTGNLLANTLTGNDSSNNLAGRAGDDILDGKAGRDHIAGGAGFDTMTGGEGRDTFEFAHAVEIGHDRGRRDLVTDFSSQVDRLDFSDLDANLDKKGNQHFKFIGDQAFSGQAGELNYVIQAELGDCAGRPRWRSGG